jgi:hypothetical protein
MGWPHGGEFSRLGGHEQYKWLSTQQPERNALNDFHDESGGLGIVIPLITSIPMRRLIPMSL